MFLLDYLNAIHLPNALMTSEEKMSSLFIKENIFNLWDAIEYIHKLPYGRTQNRENFVNVLYERKGACSGKHALIAALAKELSIPLQLTLGIFLLTAETTPKVIPILKKFQIDAIPEAHCYLKYHEATLDLTFPEASEFSFNAILEEEFKIEPQQIGAFKVNTHQAFIQRWSKLKNLHPDIIWSARETWIAQLS